MTKLSLAVRNHLAQFESVTDQLAKSATWPTWIFNEHPLGVRFESNSSCLIVVNEVDEWATPNEHNRAYFPTIQIDVWADPDRRSDKTILRDNAKDKIKDIGRAVDYVLHLMGGHPSGWYVWGGPDEGGEPGAEVYIASSKKASGPSFSPIADTEKAWMGRFYYRMETA